MDRILKAKHWHIFILLILGLGISNLTVSDDPLTNNALNMAGMMIYFSYPLFIGHFLFNFLPDKIKLSHTLFLINSFIWLTAYFIIMILSDSVGMTFKGLAAIPMFYVFFAFLHFLSFWVFLELFVN